MPHKPNILFFMCDQLQARVFEKDHTCRTPNIDSLIEEGVRFQRAYTPNAVRIPTKHKMLTR